MLTVPFEISKRSDKKEDVIDNTFDNDAIGNLIDEVLAKYPDSVNDYKNGKDNAFKFLMGMIMKESKGKANPKVASDILKDKLNN